MRPFYWCRLLATLTLICGSALFGQTGTTYEVHHRHLRRDGVGTLRIGEKAIAFDEKGKGAPHSRTWNYDDIQQLVLSEDTLRIVTYEDQRWQLGRDRVYVFDELPVTLAGDAYAMLSGHLDRRFVAAFADNQIEPLWQLPAKLTHGRNGSQGLLLFGREKVVYRSGEPGESRTWRMNDLENVASGDPFDLTITTHERDFRFQLKEALPEAQFHRLWQEINLRHGLQILSMTAAAAAHSPAANEHANHTGEHK